MVQRRIGALLTLAVLVVAGLTAPYVNAASKPVGRMMTAGQATTGMWTWEQTNLYSRPAHRVVGNVYFSYSWKTGMTTARVTVMGMVPGTVHPSHIHLGRCDTNGPVIVPFPAIHIGSNGMGMTMATFRGGFAHKPWYINVHMGPGMMTMAQAMPIACGNVL